MIDCMYVRTSSERVSFVLLIIIIIGHSSTMMMMMRRRTRTILHYQGAAATPNVQVSHEPVGNEDDDCTFHLHHT